VVNLLRKLFSGSDEVSWGRVGSAVSLLFVLGWVTYLVARNRVLPDLAGATAFVAAIYGVSKAGEAVQRLRNGNGQPKAGA
jgi:hypothetical protein